MKLFPKKFVPGLARLQAFAHDTALLPSKTHAAVFTFAVFISTNTMAATISGFFTKWTGSINALISLVAVAGIAVGVMAVLYGIIQMIKKGMGRGDDVEWSHILWPIAGGGLASILLYVLQAVVEEGGATANDMGKGRS